ncbi:MAG: hypothetical protein OEL77_06590 [Nitrosopumilus sp.]|nr:hypothetical protein [Nitrosopumilus sp.]MDH3385663.1 hypothetical protein [Nitrosopumilus sp.]
MENKISRFNSITELRESLDERIKILDDKITLQSKLIGDKIRDVEQNNTEELSDLKEKLNPEKTKDKKNDNKNPENKKRDNKKNKNRKTEGKKNSKKGKSEDWIDYQGLHLYNGIGTRGELELYFKSLEEMKKESERLKNTRDSLEQLMKSGIKKELAGIGYEQYDGPYELAFIKTDTIREKFAFKSILTVGCE